MQEIPVIDFDTLDRATTRQSLDRACREWGFFYLEGNAIDTQLVDRMHAAMHAFFAQPATLKKKRRTHGQQSLGLLRP